MAKQFSQYLEIPILKFKVPEGNPYLYFLNGINEQQRETPHFIIDRAHLSNYAYNGRLGGGVLNMNQLWRIDARLKQLGTWLFLFVDESTAIMERLKTREGRSDQAETLTREEIGTIQNRFFEVYDASALEPKGSFKLTQLIDPDEGEPTAQFYLLTAKMAEVIATTTGKKASR